MSPSFKTDVASSMRSAEAPFSLRRWYASSSDSRLRKIRSKYRNSSIAIAYCLRKNPAVSSINIRTPRRGSTAASENARPCHDTTGDAFAKIEDVERKKNNRPTTPIVMPRAICKYARRRDSAASVVFHSVVDLFSARRARPTFSMIDSAVAVQMYGIGFSLC